MNKVGGTWYQSDTDRVFTCETTQAVTRRSLLCGAETSMFHEVAVTDLVENKRLHGTLSVQLTGCDRTSQERGFIRRLRRPLLPRRRKAASGKTGREWRSPDPASVQARDSISGAARSAARPAGTG